MKTFALQQKPSAAPTPQRSNPVFSTSRQSLLSPNARTLADLCTPLIQPKLTVNQPGDQYEQEADWMAAEVMRSNAEPSQFSIPTGVQKAGGNNGHTLSKNTVAFPTPRVGHSFSKVRVTAPPMPIQPKLTINQPGDRYEQEADQVAEEVMRSSSFFGGGLSFGNPPNVQKKCAACESGGGLCPRCAEEENRLQRKSLPWSITPLVQREQAQPSSSQNSHITAGLNTRVQALTNTGGTPLPESERAFFEPRFGFDFSKVKIFHGSKAANLSRGLNARAFTLGNNIAFGAGQYMPETDDGRKLIAHELTHVVQQNTTLDTTIQRWQVSADNTTELREPPTATLTISLSGMRFDIPEEYYFSAGPTRPQLMAAILKTLVGNQYRHGMEEAVIRELESEINNLEGTGSLATNAAAVAGQLAIGSVTISASASATLITILRRVLSLEVQLDEEQVRLINLGAASELAYEQVEGILPRWYTSFIFDREMAQHGELLEQYQQAARGSSQNGLEARERILSSIVESLSEPAEVLEAIRVDYEIGNFHYTSSLEAGRIYRTIWRLGTVDPIRIAPGANRRNEERINIDEETAVNFLRYVRTHPQLADDARQNSVGRVALLEHFARFSGSAEREGGGDEQVLGRPATLAYEYPPLPAEIDGEQVQPVGGTGIYIMEIDYSAASQDLLIGASWAFQRKRYRWEVWNITNNPNVRALIEQEGQSSRQIAYSRGLQAQAEQIRTGELASSGPGSGRVVGRTEGNAQNLERTTRELEERPAQIEADRQEALAEGRYWDALANDINQATYGLEVLTSYGSELLSATVDLLTDDRERQIPWNQPGVFVVRCIAVFNPDAEENEPVRAPSVAAKAVVVRELEQISREAIDAPEEVVQELEVQLALLRRLPEGDPDRELIPRLEQELQRQRIHARGTIIDILRYELDRKDEELQEARRTSIFLPHGLHDSRVWRLENEYEDLQDQYELARVRATEIASAGVSARRAQGVLVSEVTGETYPLLLQIGEPYLDDGEWKCRLSDVTDQNRSEYTGSAPNIPENIQQSKTNAVWEAVERFAGQAGYGRGSLTVRLPAEGWFAGLSPADRTRTMPSRERDWAAARARLEELASIIALLGLVVSAPAVGIAGAALGAALAGERIARRISDGTFRWDDDQTVGDLIDIFSGFATGVRAFGALRYFNRPGGGFVLRMVRRAGEVAETTEEILDTVEFVQVSIETTNELITIGEQVRNGDISATEGRRQIASLIVSAANAGIQFGAGLRGESASGRHAAVEGGGPRPIRFGGATQTGETTSLGTETALPTTITEDQPLRVEPNAPSARLEPPTPSVESRAAQVEQATALSAPQTPRTHETIEQRGAVEQEVPRTAGGESTLQEAFDRMPEGTVIMDADPTNASNASIIFENTRREDHTREVALYRNTVTGEFITIQGDSGSVYVLEPATGGAAQRQAPYGQGYAQRWKEILDSNQNVGEWILLAHSHPVDPVTGVVADVNRFPSGAQGDMGVVIGESARAGGQSRVSRIHYQTAGDVTDFTDFGYDPSSQNPLWINYPNPNTGQRETLQFPNLETYHQWMQQAFNVDLGPIPQHLQATTTQQTLASTANEGPEQLSSPLPPTGEGAEQLATPSPSPRGGRVITPQAPRRRHSRSAPLQDENGHLTAAGVAFVRQRFRRIRDSEGRSLSSMPDEQIRQQYSHEWRWVEAVVKREANLRWRGRQTQTDFLLIEHTLSEINTILQQRIAGAQTGQTLNPQILEMTVYDLVQELISQNDPILKSAYDACERQFGSGDSPRSGAWHEFLWLRGRGARRGLRSEDIILGGFMFGKVGDTRPDIAEVSLHRNTFNITDASLAYGNLIHNFKTAFYVAVVRRLIPNAQVSGVDYRSRRRQRVIGS